MSVPAAAYNAAMPEAQPTIVASPRMERITDGPLLPGILRFGLPMVAAMTLHGAFNLVDAWFVGQLENAAVPLAAIGLCDPLLMIGVIFANGVSTASVAGIARACGGGRMNDARVITAQSLILVAALSALFGAGGAVSASGLASLLEAPGEVHPLATHYLQVMFAGSFTMIFLLQLTAILRGAGDARGPTTVLIVANLLNVIADPFLIYGWAGLPAMGLMGAAWATLGARMIGCLLALFFCLRSQHGLMPSGREWRVHGPRMRELIRLAAPNSLQLVIRVAAILALIGIVNAAFTTPDNPAPAAAFGLGIRIDMIALFAATGWGAAATTYVGQNLGAGKPERALRAAMMSAAAAFAMMLVFGALVVIFAEPLVRLFADGDARVVEIGAEYLRYLAPSYAFAAVAATLSLALNGAGSTKAPAIIDFVVYALLIVPMARIAAFSQSPDMADIWLIVAFANLVLAMVYALWSRKGIQRRVGRA